MTRGLRWAFACALAARAAGLAPAAPAWEATVIGAASAGDLPRAVAALARARDDRRAPYAPSRAAWSAVLLAAARAASPATLRLCEEMYVTARRRLLAARADRGGMKLRPAVPPPPPRPKTT